MSIATCPACSNALAADAAFCPNCGSPVPPPFQQPEMTQPQVQADTSPTPRRRGLGMLGVVVGVAGLAALGFVGYRLFKGTTDEFVGGASSPEQAVTSFAAALSDEDLLGAFAYVAPDEIDGARDVIEHAMEALDEQGGGLGLDGVDLQLTIDNVDVRTEGDRAAVVTFELAGSIGSSPSDTGTGPIGLALPTSESFVADNLSDLFPGRDGEVEVVTVRLGDGWFVSPMLSYGNLIVENADLPSGDFDRVGEERGGGAGDPEEAVENMVAAIVDRDVDDLAESLGGGEGRFVAVFADAIDSLLSEISSDVTYEVEVRTSPLDDGRVELDRIEINGADFDSWVTVEIRGDCVTARSSSDYDYDDGDGDGDGDDRDCLLDSLRLQTDVDDSIVLHTAKEDGATRVRLVPSLTELADRFVPAFDRQTVLSGLGLAWADTATPVAVPSDTEVALEPGTYAVFQFPAAAGQSYRVASPDGDTSVYVEQTDGRWDYQWGLLTVEDDTAIRVLIDNTRTGSCDDCDVDTTLRVRQVPRQAAPFPSVLSGELGPGDAIVFDLTVDQAQTVAIDLDAADSVRWRTEDGSWSYVADDTYSLEPGEYSLLVSNDGESVEPYSLVPSSAAVGFDGAMSTDGSLADGGFSSLLALTPGSWTIAAEQNDGQDIVLEIPYFDCYADSEVHVAEYCYLDVSSIVTVDVYVSPYSDADGYGSVRLSVS